MTTTRPNFAPTALAIAISLSAANLHAADLPTGGNIVGGSGSISQSGNTLNVQQNSDKLITNWDSFDIGAGHTVNFYQPGSNSVALNRVIGEDASAIYGNLNANGKVFLVNPNGVLFGQGAAVNVGALVASTLSLSDEDFNDGNYQFSGDGSNAAVINRGSITADGGAVALLGGQVSNHGIIQANQGSVALAAGDKITLDFAGDGLVNVTVDEGTLNALAENHQLVRANGGQVIMTANATNALLQTVVNNTGIVEAQTLDNQNGTIVLKGGFNGGTVNVAGTLDASAPESGDGGFIDTSGAHVKIAGGTRVTTKANHGTTGEWLIDPTDFTISDSSDPQTASGIGAATLSANLENNNVTLETVDTGTEPGDMYVNGAVSWSADHTLSLNAHNDIHINQAITATNGGLTLNAGGAISANGAVNVGTFNLQSGAWSQLGSNLADFSARDFHLNTANASFLRANGGDGSDGNAYQIFDLYGLQGIASRSLLSSHVALTNNIDASGTVNWNGGAGFVPIGDWSNRYTGSFDGQGHSINDLTINRPNTDYVGLFGVIAASQISNIGLTNATITGQLGVGGLVGQGLNNSRISHSSAQGDFSAYLNGGGLAGNFDGTIEHSHSVGTVDASEISGGLVGRLVGQISDSYSTASVKGDFGGGLVGIMNGGQISRSYATGQVKKDIFGPIGGLIGSISIGTITNSYWNTETSGQASAVGLGSSAGSTGLTTAQMFDAANFSGFDFADTWANADNQTTPYLRALAGNRVFNKNDLPTGTINATNRPALYTVIQNVEQLQAMRDNLSANYLLGNDIDATATASWNGGAGFDPLGVSNNSFSGQLDGMGYIVDGLTIQRGDQLGVGLFGYTTADSQIRNLGLTDVNIQGQSFVGSLVGKSLGLLDGVFATGRVGGDFVVGGLAGSSQGSITESYAATDIEAFSIAGGLVGSQGPGIYDSATRTRSTSSVDNSYATGTIKVTVDPASGSAGGLVGMLDGAISNSYSTVIINETSAGLVGSATQGVFTNVYYANTDRDGNTLDTAGLDFGGRSWAKMTELDAFNTWGSDIDAEGGTGAIWRIYEGHSTPMLRHFLTALEVAGENSTTTYNGTEQGGSWNAAGAYDADRIFGQPVGGKNAGTYALDMNGLYSDQQGYDLITTSGGTLTINKAQATVTANSGTTTYNGTEQSVSGFTVDGLVNGEDASVLTGVTTSGGKGTNAGSYVLTVGGGSSDNYELTFVDGQLTINKAQATVTANSGTTTYNGTEQSVSGFTVDGLVNGEDASVLTGVTTSGGKGTNAGSYTLTASGTDGNYELSFVDGALTINKAQATVTANSSTTTYNGTEQNGTGFTVNGLVNGEDQSVLSDVTVSGGGRNAGTYVLTASGSDGNYELTFVDGKLTINKAQATVTANSGTTTYNGTEQSVDGFTVDGLVNGEDASVLSGVTTSGGKGTNAGNYTLTASGSDGNYELSFVDGKLTINKAQATVTANSGTTTYNGTEQSVSGFTVDGLVNGEDQSVLTGVTTSGGKGINAGSYTLTASGTDGNYELSFVNGTLTIERKAITGNITADGKTYDGNTYANTHGTLDGVISGDDLQFNTTGAFADKYAGTGKQVTVSGSIVGGDAGNYVLTTNSSTTANIDRKTITADIRALDKLFDGSLTATLEGMLNGTISGDDVALQLNGLFASLAPGENRVLVDASLTGADAGNYQLVAPDSVTANMQGFVQGAAYQSAIVSQPPQLRQLQTPADPEGLLTIEQDPLGLADSRR